MHCKDYRWRGEYCESFDYDFDDHDDAGKTCTAKSLSKTIVGEVSIVINMMIIIIMIMMIMEIIMIILIMLARLALQRLSLER